jgi:hypothetical protein
MKISDLIELLQDAIENFGDLETGGVEDRSFVVPCEIGLCPVGAYGKATSESNPAVYMVVG